jgi:curved DNA-binding protein CbpA
LFLRRKFHGVTDYFSLLDEPRRPRIEADRLRQKFRRLAADLHPDRIHNAGDAEKAAANRHYASLNAAYVCLAEPKTRLLHLLELERGARPAEIQTIPPALAGLFAGIANVCREVDAFGLERAKVTSPLLKIQWFERAQEWIGRLNSWRQELGGLRGELDARLEHLDQEWLTQTEDRKPATLAKLEELYRLFGYFNRWQNQLQERINLLTCE